jgi:ectoine hydroxylase-related dioxygenase (phytanoyl-CoA dioxygenase family)
MNAPAYRLHPRNHDFAWQSGGADALRRLTTEQLRQFDEMGFFILRGAFAAAELDAVEAAVDPLEQEHERRLRATEGDNDISSADAITFTGHIVKQSDVLRAFAAHPAIADICHDLIGNNVRLYWDQSVYKKSGKPQEFPWHQDNGYTFVDPQQYLTFWIPLVDVDVRNGCPWIAPGMHKLGTLEHWVTPIGLKCLEDVPDAVPAPAKRGDAIIFSSLAPHRTGPNLKEGTVRKAYILQYAPEGAEAIKGGERIPQNDPARQFPILVEGERP